MSRAVYEQFRVQVKQEILQKLDCGLDFSDGQVRRLIDERLCRSDCIGRLDVAERRKLGRELFAAIRGFDVLQELLEDKRITEIMVNGPDRIFIEKDGRLTQWQGWFESPARLLDVIQQIAAGCNRVVNEASPILDARLSDGSRVNVVLSPVALNGPAMTIRRFPEEGMTLDRLVALGSITEECKSFLELLVKCRYNIFISGGTGSGKTTFMKMIAGLVKPTSGTILYENEPIGVQSKREIAYLPTESFFYSFMTVKDVGIYYRDFFEDFDMEKYAKLIADMDLRMEDKASKLSSGMAAKLKIAATLARAAKLYLLDEPLNGIDIIAREKVVTTILNAVGEESSVVISSHLVDELEAVVDSVIFIKEGRNILQGEAEQIREQRGKSIVELYKEIYA